jgi:protocatechuate 3,4-dioxygenase beta subunit
MEFSRRHNEIQYNPKSGGTQIKKTLVRLTPRIEGTVRDTEGKPVPGVYVRMDLDQGGWHTAFGGGSYSDEQGKIGFTVQSGQKYRCMIEDPHWDAPTI